MVKLSRTIFGFLGLAALTALAGFAGLAALAGFFAGTASVAAGLAFAMGVALALALLVLVLALAAVRVAIDGSSFRLQTKARKVNGFAGRPSIAPGPLRFSRLHEFRVT
jgi:hypothetical protein